MNEKWVRAEFRKKVMGDGFSSDSERIEYLRAIRSLSLSLLKQFGDETEAGPKKVVGRPTLTAIYMFTLTDGDRRWLYVGKHETDNASRWPKTGKDELPDGYCGSSKLFKSVLSEHREHGKLTWEILAVTYAGQSANDLEWAGMQAAKLQQSPTTFVVNSRLFGLTRPDRNNGDLSCSGHAA